MFWYIKNMLQPLSHWKCMRHMKSVQWELAWRLRRHPRWVWRSGMGMLYPDGSFANYQGFILPAGEPLPYLINDRTAGCLLGLLAEAGPGWQTLLHEELQRGEDWREGVARALLRAWTAHEEQVLLAG